MARRQRSEGVEVARDLPFQKREWVFERVGWAVMAVIVLLALLGLLGNGPLSSTSAADALGRVKVEYDRFLHYQEPSRLRIHVSGAVTAGDEFRLAFSQDFLDRVEIKRIDPVPTSAETGEGRHVYVFRVADRGKPTTVTVHFEAERPGVLDARLEAGGGEPLEFWQFVYP